jgi:hypothetical protein
MGINRHLVPPARPASADAPAKEGKARTASRICAATLPVFRQRRQRDDRTAEFVLSVARESVAGNANRVEQPGLVR